MNDYQNEWAILHGDIERYERFSLLIKLVSVVLCVALVVLKTDLYFSVIIILVLWLQDGIWKTFQQRLQVRILFVEQQMKEAENTNESFQLYTQWEGKRRGMVGLVKEYVLSSLKPTIAYPYVVLVLLVITEGL